MYITVLLYISLILYILPRVGRQIVFYAATWLSVYSLGPDPIGNIALALFCGQPFPSNAFFLSCLSGRYQVTSTPQAYNFDVLFYNTLYFWTIIKDSTQLITVSISIGLTHLVHKNSPQEPGVYSNITHKLVRY
jgi:hypothetical protein